MYNSYYFRKKSGGVRERAGRPKIGTTRQIKLTLTDETWQWIEDAVANKHADNRSEFLRNIIEHAKN
ncbi:hypothetical protein ACFQZE_24485 [Paenibacillus sp. GCM10027627]|uniref:hypothetical protein n=1 Tax=unclassified Paenibacillus TaxID=185978 RepID=UPI0036380381